MRLRLLFVMTVLAGVLVLPSPAFALNPYWISEYLRSFQSGVAADFYAYDWSLASGGMRVSSCYMYQWPNTAIEPLPSGLGDYYVEAGLFKWTAGGKPLSAFYAYETPWTNTQMRASWPVQAGQYYRFHIANWFSNEGAENWTVYVNNVVEGLIPDSGFAKGAPLTFMERKEYDDSGNHRATFIRYLNNSTMAWTAWPGMNLYDQDTRFVAVPDSDNAWHTAYQ